jgi:hypothetical protein
MKICEAVTLREWASHGKWYFVWHGFVLRCWLPFHLLMLATSFKVLWPELMDAPHPYAAALLWVVVDSLLLGAGLGCCIGLFLWRVCR